MKKLLLILLCLPMIGFAQGWEKRLGGIYNEFAQSVQQTTDGGYIITGCSYKANSGTADADVFLLKTNGNGDSLWNQTFGGTSSDYGLSVQQTTDGGYIITGNTYSLGNSSQAYLIKTDGNGIEQWSKNFGGTDADWGISVQQTTDGGYIIAGRANYTINPATLFETGDVYLIKTDGNGNQQWTKNFGGINQDGGRSVQQTTDGGYIITGFTTPFLNGLTDVYLIKTDGNGIEQWTKTFGGTSDDDSRSVQQTTDGGYIITGWTESFGNGAIDVYLIKTDGNGIEQWTKTFGGVKEERGFSVQQTTDGGYIITGWTGEIDQGQTNVYLIKTDQNGDSLWTKTFGYEPEDDIGFSVQQTTDGGYIITGFSYNNSTFFTNYDVYLIKTDGNGNATSTFNIPINPNRKLQKTVDMLGKETKPKTNIPFIEIYDDGTVEKRIVIE